MVSNPYHQWQIYQQAGAWGGKFRANFVIDVSSDGGVLEWYYSEPTNLTRLVGAAFNVSYSTGDKCVNLPLLIIQTVCNNGFK